MKKMVRLISFTFCFVVIGSILTAHAESYYYGGALLVPTPAGAASALRSLDFENGLIYAGDCANNSVSVLDPAEISITEPHDSVVLTIGHTQDVIGVSVDTQGNVWAVDGDGTEPKLWVADPTSISFAEAFTISRGSYGMVHASNDMTVVTSYGSDTAHGLALHDSAGNVIIDTNEYGGYAAALSPDESTLYVAQGNKLTEDWSEYGSSMSDAMVYALTMDASDPLNPTYSVSSFSFFNEMCYSPGTLPSSGNASADYHVTSVTTDGEGNIWIATRNTSTTSVVYSQFNAVLKFTPDGTLLDKFNAWDPVTGETYFEINYTDRVALRNNTLGCIYGIAYDDATDTVYISGNYTAGSSSAAYQLSSYDDVGYVLAFYAVPEPNVLIILITGMFGVLTWFYGKRK